MHIPSLDELLELPFPEDARLSPNGQQVLFTLPAADWKENDYIRQVWQVSLDDPRPRQLTFAKTSSASPRWSPDGDWIAFLSKRPGDEHTQLYRLPACGGEAERLTESPTDIQSFEWAPDSSRIAFLAPEPPGEVDKQRAETYGDYHVEDADFTRTHLWVLELEPRRTLRLLNQPDQHTAVIAWSPNSRLLAVESWPSPRLEDMDRGSILLVDVQTLDAWPLTTPGCTMPRFSPDGAAVAYLRYGTPSYYKNPLLCRVPTDGGAETRLMPDFDESITLVAWGPQGLFFTAHQRDTIALFCLDIKTRQVARVSPQAAGWYAEEYTFDAAFTCLAAVAADREHAAEVVILDLAGGAVRRLTDYTARTQDWKLGRIETLEWASQDGTPIEGVLTYPADYEPGRRCPLLVVIHGGPTWASFSCLLGGSQRRYYPVQAWAGRGAFILEPNYRGSAGYGEAFRSLNVRNLGVGDAWDVLSGVDALIARGLVDPDRMGAMGWSQGGYISAYLTTHTDRFKAISVGAGISDWMTYYANTDIPPFTRQYLEATPWDDPEIYARTSPVTGIQKACTPTLIQHGELDRRVPIPNAYELYRGLRDRGVEARLVVYKGMPHGISKPRLQRQVMQENLDWFGRWIWGDAPAEKPLPPCYVALCSAEKNNAPGELPALERYTGEQVMEVYRRARAEAAGFRIFSGRYGLLEAGDPLPWYDHRLEAEEVPALAAKVAGQLRAQGWKKLVVFTAPAEKDPWSLVYLGCLQVAAGLAGGVSVDHQTL